MTKNSNKRLQPTALPVVYENEIQQPRAAARYIALLVRALRAALDDIYRILSRHEPVKGQIVLTMEEKTPGDGYEAAGQIGGFYAWRRVK